MRVRSGALRRAVLLFLFALWPGVAAMAQEIELYEGEVEVPSQSDAAREAALPQALAMVLMRLTGVAPIGADPAVQAELGQAPALLQHYRYRQDVAAGGAARTMLIGRFDRAGVDALLAKLGRSAWPTPRPVPVVWLAIDDGRGARMLGSAQASAVQALTRQAELRGLRLSYPLLDLEEQQKLVVSAFWAGDSATARRGSARYQSRVSLVGKLYRSASGWTAEWKLYDGEQLLAEVTPSAPEAGSVLAAGADLAADTLAGRSAQLAASSGPSGVYTVWVEGIVDAEDYGRALNYFSRLSVVRSLKPLQVEQQRLQLELDLRTGLEGLQSLVESGTALSLVEQPDPAIRVFRLLP